MGDARRFVAVEFADQRLALGRPPDRPRRVACEVRSASCGVDCSERGRERMINVGDAEPDAVLLGTPGLHS